MESSYSAHIVTTQAAPPQYPVSQQAYPPQQVPMQPYPQHMAPPYQQQMQMQPNPQYPQQPSYNPQIVTSEFVPSTNGQQVFNVQNPNAYGPYTRSMAVPMSSR